jgi:predicted alpha-1,2-mannosidase
VEDLTRYMDPFFGNGTIDLPRPEGIAATWFFIKAQTGNTTPAACVPFGMISACAYSGAYPTGYGLNAPNTHGAPAQRFDRYLASGFTHLQQSGTGAIESYYNYLRVTPLRGELGQLGMRWALEDEVARPGYYAATLAGAGIRAELTASAVAALHRYTFDEAGLACIAVDLTNGGIDFPGQDTTPTEAEVTLVSAGAAQGYIVVQGMRLYFHVAVDGAAGRGALWVDRRKLPGRRTLSLGRMQKARRSFGVVFHANLEKGGALRVRVGLSLRNAERARAHAETLAGHSLEEVAEEARQAWNAHANRLQVAGGTEAQRTIFYSSLYHSLIKPANWRGESPYWDEEPFCLDFATMWDQYKTQLPLIVSLYPEHGRDVVHTLIALGEHVGYFPNGLILDADMFRFENQSRSLAHYAIADAYYRRLEGIDWRRALAVMVADLRHPRAYAGRPLRDALTNRVTHMLDVAGACFCTAQLAAGLGEDALAAEMMERSTRWRSAYDRDTGRLIEARYYEGGLWNYSFRLLHDMAGRIALYADEDAFVADLDRFFGYGQPPVVQPADPQDRAYMRWGHALNRFEGYNNEPDIETPYAYLYAGRHDRTAEVVQAGMRYMFTTGRGGLPGNNDSGGLTSCYLWNAVGLFPVAGQPVYLIGSPLFDAASLQLGERRFTIERAPGAVTLGASAHTYVQRATLNGTPLERAYLYVDEVHAGGALRLEMGPAPSGWARSERPPSWEMPHMGTRHG